MSSCPRFKTWWPLVQLIPFAQAWPMIVQDLQMCLPCEKRGKSTLPMLENFQLSRMFRWLRLKIARNSCWHCGLPCLVVDDLADYQYFRLYMGSIDCFCCVAGYFIVGCHCYCCTDCCYSVVVAEGPIAEDVVGRQGLRWNL